MPKNREPPETIGPYQIEDLLGIGGMGEVYRAYDPRLGRRVAVKHIRPEFVSRPGYRKRLEREARTIASLDHPSIVQIFDVLRTEDGGEWIVMEFVDGPTVHKMLDSSGPLEIVTALSIGLDVIHGLAQAHGRNILHRDLKSENVMVAPSGVAKILDFGLAKRLLGVDEASISVEGKVIGTCRVMAPEQANGLELDGRADLFAFGVLLYEMVTARSPFQASTPVASMLKAFSHPHTSVLDFNPDVPTALSDLIDQLLEKNRDERPDSAPVVAAALSAIGEAVSEDSNRRAGGRDELPSRASASWASRGAASAAASSRAALSEPVSSGSTADAVPPSASRWSNMWSTAFGLGLPVSRRFAVWASWLGLLVLAGWWILGPKTRPQPAEPRDARIVVLPFENQGPAQMKYFAAGLTDELIRELASRRHLAVVSYKTSTHYGAGSKSLREIGEELDIGYVLEGAVTSDLRLDDDARLRITLRLIRVSDGQVLLSRSFNRVASDTLRVQSDIADAVAAELGAQILADSRHDLSADPMALDAYFRGLALWHASGYSLEVVQQAERLFNTAAEEDPDFVQAWAELSRVRSFLFFNWDRSPEGRRRAEDAVSRARDLAPRSISVLLASGYFEYHVQEDLTKARREFARAAKKAPSHPEVQEAIGLVLRRQGRLSEAISNFERAFDLDRANSALAGFLAETERARRAYSRAERWFSIALQRSSELPYVVGERAENTLARVGCGSFSEPPECAVAEAERVLDASEIGESPSLWGYRVRVAIFDLANGGSRESFLDLFDSVPESEIEQSEFLLLFWRKALALRELGRDVEATALAVRSHRMLAELAAGSELGTHHALLSLALALLGREEEALVVMDRALEFASLDSFTGPRVKRWAAAVSMLVGDDEQAVRYLTEISRQDYQWSLASYEIHADPLWQPLRDLGALDQVWNELRRREATRID